MSGPELAGFVLRLLAEAGGRRSDSPALRTTLLELDLDSLTLVSILTRVEAAYDLELDDHDLLALLEARDVGALIEVLEARLPGG